MQGWITLNRKIQEHWLWTDKPFSKGQAWVDLLLLANHKDNRFMLGNELIDIKRGSFVTSELKLMDRWGWSKTKVRNFLKILENENMLSKKSDRKKTTITIVNYSVYQNIATTEKPQENHEETTRKPQENHAKTQTTMINNDNHKNNDNNNNIVVVGAENIDSDFKYIFKEYNKNIHPMTPIEAEKIQNWLNDLSCEVVIKAIEQAALNNVRTFNYINAILNNWNTAGVKDIDSLNAYLAERQKKKKKNNNNKPNRFHNFEQKYHKYSDDDYEKFMSTGKKNNKEEYR